MENNVKILIVVPAYNEEDNIIGVIDSLIYECNYADILVINDGSKDNTEQKARSKNVKVISQKLNLGIGGTVQTGFKFASKYNYDIVVQFDGDGQHNAFEIKRLIIPIIENLADVVIGSRFLNKGGFQSTFLRRLGIKIFEYINSILINQKITDNTSGFRAYNKKAIDFLADNYPQDFPEPEAIIILGKKNLKLIEIPVIMNERSKGKSSITGFKSHLLNAVSIATFNIQKIDTKICFL